MVWLRCYWGIWSIMSSSNLKTLIDIEKKYNCSTKYPCMYNNQEALSVCFNIKQEAIKWVEYWKEQLPKGCWIRIDDGGRFIFEDDFLTEERFKNLISSISSFVNFFNITEEDLK